LIIWETGEPFVDLWPWWKRVQTVFSSNDVPR
jgi:hypothetical protein